MKVLSYSKSKVEIKAGDIIEVGDIIEINQKFYLI